MPELPEVQTTVNGINSEVKNLTITDVWTDYNSLFHANKQNIKNPEYFGQFKKDVVGAKILKASRKGKNVLIHLSPSKYSKNENIVLIHMKMTGHLMHGKYVFTPSSARKAGATAGTWEPEAVSGPLRDPYNKFLHLVFSLSDGKHLVFSDLRKFAKVLVYKTKDEHLVSDLAKLGPDPLSPEFTYKVFKERILKRPTGKIKQVLLDQQLISGIGNIYSDEILFEAGVHPESHPNKIPEKLLKKMHVASIKILKKGIDFGGDSDSDYRNIHGERGAFQNKHHAYRHTGEKCSRRDGGTIERKMIGGRSGHFCPVHQIKYS